MGWSFKIGSTVLTGHNDPGEDPTLAEADRLQCFPVLFHDSDATHPGQGGGPSTVIPTPVTHQDTIVIWRVCLD